MSGEPFFSAARRSLDNIDWGKWGIRAGSLVLAFFLWLYAVTEHYYKKELVIRLQVEDPASGSPRDREVMVANLMPKQVRVAVSGKGKRLLQLDSDFFLMRLSPEGRAGTARTYRLMPELVETRVADLGVKLEEVIEPREIEIVLDWRAVREVPVKPVVELEVAERYIQVGETAIEPRMVEISGPQTQIATIEYVKTDSLVRKQVHDRLDELLALRPPAKMRCILNPAQVRVMADVQILAQDELLQVPVKVRHSTGRRVEAEPSRVRVKVKGGIDIIANLEAEKDLELFVDYREYRGVPLAIRYEAPAWFEIVELAPSMVELVER